MDILIRGEIQLASSGEDKSKNRILLCGWVLFYYRAGDQSSIDESIPKKWMKESSQHHHNVTHPHDCHAVRIHVCSFSVELTPRTDDVIAFLFLTVTCLGLLKSAEHALHCRQLSPQKGAHQSSLQKHVNGIAVKINCYTADWRGELHNGCSLHGQHTGPPTTRWEIAPLQHI